MSAEPAHSDVKRVESAPLSAQGTPNPNLLDKDHPSHPHHRLDKIATLGLICFSTNLFALSGVFLQWRGANVATSLAALTGPFLWIGGAGHLIPGIIELINGKHFQGSVLIYFGCLWGVLESLSDPHFAIAASYAKGPLDPAYTAPLALILLSYAIVSAFLAIVSVRASFSITAMFILLVIAFPILAEAFFQQGQAASVADLGHVMKLFKVAGGFTLAVSLLGFLAALGSLLEAVGLPGLPVHKMGH